MYMYHLSMYVSMCVSICDSDSDEGSVVTESDHEKEVEDLNTLVTDSSNPWLQSMGQKVMKGAEPVLLLDSEMMSQTGSGNISKHSQNQTGDLGDLMAVPSQENESEEETWQEKEASENESDNEKYGSESSNIKHSKPKTSNVTSLRTKTIPKSTDSHVINPDDFLKTESQGAKVFSLSSDNLLAVQEAFAGFVII